MKYIIRVFLILIYIIYISSTYVIATDSEIITSQQEELNISGFIKETEKYTKEVLTDIDINDIFTSALTGKIDNNKILSKILGLFGNEIKEAITVLRYSTHNNYYT